MFYLGSESCLKVVFLHGFFFHFDHIKIQFCLKRKFQQWVILQRVSLVLIQSVGFFFTQKQTNRKLNSIPATHQFSSEATYTHSWESVERQMERKQKKEKLLKGRKNEAFTNEGQVWYGNLW